MIARPIPFSPPMVRATLDGRKGQTRRIVRPQPPIGTDALRDVPRENRWWAAYAEKDSFGTTYRPLGSDLQHDWRCPYGMRGDLLWVREPWRVGKPHDHKRPSEILGPLVKRGKGVTVLYEAGGWRSVGPADRVEPIYLDDEPMPKWAGKYRHARFMPRWASRLTLRITEIRVERLQEISEPDALAEGVTMPELEREEFDASLCARCGGTLLYMSVANGGAHFDTDCTDCSTARDRYRHLWNFINGADSWAANPWVWVIAFAVIKANVDEVMKREAA